MSAKPIVTLACAALLGAGFPAPRASAATPVTLVLFPRTLTSDDDVKALVDVRKKLRTDASYEVITYDPNSSAIKRAAGEAHHPEWLSDPMGNDSERLALTRALGAAFSIVIAKADGHGKMDVRVGEAAPSGRTWSGYDEKADNADRFIRQQAAFALVNRIAGSPVTASASPSPVRASTPPAVPQVVVVAPVPVSPPSAAPATSPAPVLPPVVVPAPAPITPVPAPAPSAPLSAVPVPAVPVPAVPVPAVPVPTAPPVNPAVPPAILTPRVSAPVRAVPSVPAPTVLAPNAAPASAAPARVSRPDQTLVVPSPLPIPAPSREVIVTTPPVTAPPAVPSDNDLVSVRGLLTQGDDALSAGNFVAAIAAYRDAVNGAPLTMLPRLKLAQAYLQSDRRDKALSEAQRALSLAPNDPSVQQFLMQLDAETGSSDGAVARFQAVVAQNPQDPAAHLALADALWNNGALSQAEDEYKAAQALAGSRTDAAQQAAAHLARLYAAQSCYTDSLAALKQAGAGGYALALGIVQSRADGLRSMLDAGQGMMDAGKTTHEAFYKTASDAAVQAQALADFVVKVTPPSAFGISHLHRVLATHLMAQQAAVLVNYVETSDASFSGQAARLEKEAVTEMLTAHAAEQKLGLWETPRTEARN